MSQTTPPHKNLLATETTTATPSMMWPDFSQGDGTEEEQGRNYWGGGIKCRGETSILLGGGHLSKNRTYASSIFTN